MFDYYYYVSEEGSGIMLYYKSKDNLGLVSKIYPIEDIEIGLSDCKIIPEKTKEIIHKYIAD